MPSARKANDVTLSMNKILNTEMVEAIADALRKSPTQPQEPTDKGTGDSSPEPRQPHQPASGVLLFVADLLSNSALTRFFGGGRPESAVLRGSLVGLASGVEAVTDAADGAKTRQQPLGAVLTVSAYIVGGIAAALILRGLRRGAPPTVPPET